MSYINEESLIALVQQNDLLYNKANREYKSTQKKREVWEAIGLQLGASGDACSKRWSSLRDKYCRELRRLAYSSESGAIAETKWKYFGRLSFLSGHMRGERPRSNFSIKPEDVLCTTWHTPDDIELASCDCSPPLVSPSPYSSTPLPSPEESLPSTSSQQAQKRKREMAHEEQSAAFVDITKSLKAFIEKQDAVEDMRAHTFGKFVESCLTGMEEKKQMKLIGDIMQTLIAAQLEK